MLDVCGDATYEAKVSPQIYNAWGIRYMVYCRLLASGTQYDTPIPLEQDCATNSQCSPSFSIRKGS